MILLQNLHLLLLKTHQPPVLLHLTMISKYTNPAWLYPHFFLVNCASVTVMFFLAPNNFLRAQPFHHQPSVPLLAHRASQQRAIPVGVRLYGPAIVINDGLYTVGQTSMSACRPPCMSAQGTRETLLLGVLRGP